jgi:hypothetical protein
VCELRADVDVHVCGLPTKFLPHDPKPAAILARAGLDVDGIVELARG